MELNKDTKRRINSIERLIISGQIDKKGYLDMVKEINGRDYEGTHIMLRAFASAQEKYDDYLERSAMMSPKFLGVNFNDQDGWMTDKLLEKEISSRYSEKELMQNFMTKELRVKLKEREMEIKNMPRSEINEERAKVMGFSVESLKRKIGLSR